MKYNKVTFTIHPFSEDFADVLSAILCEVGFESFETTSTTLEAYIQQNLWNEEDTQVLISNFPITDIDITYTVEEAEYANWNQQWEEEGFRPIIIEDKIAVHDTKHTDIPKVEYDIIIAPCQAFGTGSHQTTRMILSELYTLPLQGMEIVDAGTGTGILSIMSIKKGAQRVFAYDIDEWSVRNTLNNLELNGISTDKVEVLEGDASVLKGQHGKDLVIANINRNILLADMYAFCSTLAESGMLLLSGFYTDDIPYITEKAADYSLSLIHKREEDGWVMLLFQR